MHVKWINEITFWDEKTVKRFELLVHFLSRPEGCEFESQFPQRKLGYKITLLVSIQALTAKSIKNSQSKKNYFFKVSLRMSHLERIII